MDIKDQYQFCGEQCLKARAMGYVAEWVIMGDLNRFIFISMDGNRIEGVPHKDACNALETTCIAFSQSLHDTRAEPSDRGSSPNT